MADFVPPAENDSDPSPKTITQTIYNTLQTLNFTTKTYNFTTDMGPVTPTVAVTMPIPER